MGDGQDRQDAAEGVSVPEESPPTVPVDDVPDDGVDENPVPETLDHEDTDVGEGLTGVLAALEEPEEPEPLNPEVAALQADLEAEGSEVGLAEVEADSVVEPAESLDDIAPGTVGGEQEASEDAEGIGLPDDRAGVPLWPFILYFALWVVFAGLLVWQSMQLPAGTPSMSSSSTASASWSVSV